MGISILRKIGFTGGDVDPCLFIKKSSKGIVYFALYVDSHLNHLLFSKSVHIESKNNLVTIPDNEPVDCK